MLDLDSGKDGGMRFSILIATALTTLMVFFGVTGSAVAQATKKNGPAQAAVDPKKAAEPVKGAGKIAEIAPNGLLRVIGPGGKEWWLQVQAKSKDTIYIAKAELGWLQPGTYVRFSTALDKKGKAQDPIKTAMVLSMRPEFPPGVIAETAERGIDTSGLFTDPEEAAAKKKAPPKKPKPETLGDAESYLVTGRIAQIKEGRFSVNTNGLSITGEFAPTAKISVELNELRGNVGDEVEFEGTRAPGTEGAVVQKIKVTAAEPLKMDEKKRGRAASTKKKAAAEPSEDKEP
jgi:hypothetical protein